jgi:hypothetical protein
MPEYNTIDEWKAKWVSLGKDGAEVSQYAQFRHEFFLEEPLNNGKPEDALLYISVDTDYAMWLNGTFVGCNQYDDFPENKAYDELPVGH